MAHQTDLERQIEFDFVRATEIAALNTLQWLGKGNKELADAAACDAIRGMFDLTDIGGAPEAVLSAAALRCLGGGMRAKIWPRDEAERKHLVAVGWGGRLDTQFSSRDLAGGDQLVFAATGISSGPLLEGVEVSGTVATTHSLVMRAKSGTVRFVEAHHDLERKTIHLRSTQAERRV